MAVELIGAPIQIVFPKCEASLRVYETTEFGLYMRFPQHHQKLQKLIDQYREYTDRDQTAEVVWSATLKDYVAAQAVGPPGIDNEALHMLRYGDSRHSNAIP